MKRILILTSLFCVGLIGCEDDSPKPIIRKKKQNKAAEEEGPQYIDHTVEGADPNTNFSQFPQANGKVPLTQNPGQPKGNIPKTVNPPPQPDPNVPQNISQMWDGKGFYSNANVEVKPVVQ